MWILSARLRQCSMNARSSSSLFWRTNDRISFGRVRPSSQPHAERPKVLSNLYHGNEQITTHNPVVLDFELEPPKGRER